ncbi:MAG: TetR/AcrR family transcriptional regulator [Parvularculaceae bacterium]
MAGRPRTFDEDAMLEAAMRRFWLCGYAGTRLDDVAAEAGVTKPSLYLAFGGKDALYEKALSRYASKYTEKLHEAFDAAPSLSAAVEAYFRFIASVLTDDAYPKGCLRVRAIAELSSDNPDLAAAAVRHRRASRDALLKRFSAELEDPDRAENLADLVVMLGEGLALTAKAGATKRQIHKHAAYAAGVIGASLIREKDLS